MAKKAKAQINLFDSVLGESEVAGDIFDQLAAHKAANKKSIAKTLKKMAKKKKPTPEKRKIPMYTGDRSTKDVGLLSLDIATKTGFCVFNRSGMMDFTPKQNDSKGMRLIKFKSFFKRMIEEYKIKLIVFEGQAVFGKTQPNFVASEMIGTLKIHCEEVGIEYRSYAPAEIKQSATGKGNADKDAMVEFAESKFDLKVVDNNEADALHLYHLALEDLNLS
jgi:Holliday junction resolvasome RuvABC endonuclease subunit